MDLGQLLLALAGGVLVTEFRAWRPWACKALIQLGRLLAPKRHRDRLAEEWRAWMEDFPGDLAKLLVAFGFVFAGLKLSAASWARLTYVTIMFAWISLPHFIKLYRAANQMYSRLPKAALKSPRTPTQVIALRASFAAVGTLYSAAVLGKDLPALEKSPSTPEKQ